jgi:hypothetical protein
MEMVRKGFLLGMLVIALAFGMTFIGCGGDDEDDPPPATPGTPVAGDFTVGNLSQVTGSVTPVTITPKAGKSTGAIIIYYAGSTTLPTAGGEYAVTFDVAAVAGKWEAATALVAGTLDISGPGLTDPNHMTLYYPLNELDGPDTLHFHIANGTVEILTIFASDTITGGGIKYIFDGTSTPMYTVPPEDYTGSETFTMNWAGVGERITGKYIVLEGTGSYAYGGGFGTSLMDGKNYLGFTIKKATVAARGDIRFEIQNDVEKEVLVRDIRFDQTVAGATFIEGSGGLGQGALP